MKNVKKIFFYLLLIFLSGSTEIFAGNPDFKSMKNWVVVKSNNTPISADIFRMENQILSISSGNSGYIRTQKIYTNFTLSVEWRWIQNPGNSGVLVHILSPDKVWPICFQAQLKADAAGDIICMNGLKASEMTDTVKFTVPKMLPSNEKQLGEWNQMQIISKNKTLKVYVNGQLQNQISGMTATNGFIGFQAEGQAMEFRNFKIIKK